MEAPKASPLFNSVVQGLCHIRPTVKALIYCVMAALLLLIVVNGAAAATQTKQLEPAKEVHLKESSLAVMARHLKMEEDLLKRDFTNITLLAMLRKYVEELDKIKLEGKQLTSKVSRWYRATSDYVERIILAQEYVESGLPFSLNVTREGWVLIIVEGIPMLVSGPKASDANIARTVKTEYCRYHDCSWLTPEKVLVQQGNRQDIVKQETWVFDQRLTPAFEIDRQFQFVFKSFKQKKFKQAVSYTALAEVKLFLAELKKAKLSGYFINWQLMSQEVPTAGVDQTVFLNTGDLYLRLTLPLLGHLKLDDWQRLLEWLKWSMTADGATLVIQHADSLLSGGQLQKDEVLDE